MDFADAIDVHGYLDATTSPYLLDLTQLSFPKKPIIYSEMSYGAPRDAIRGPILGSWARAEEQISNMIDIFSHEVTGYIDWNMILNSHGGPNYVNNVLDAPIIANENFTEIYKQPMFYAFAHFSKFVRAGCERVENIKLGWNSIKIKAIAFSCPDGSIAAIMYNKSADRTVEVSVVDKWKGSFDLKLAPKSISTVTYRI